MGQDMPVKGWQLRAGAAALRLVENARNQERSLKFNSIENMVTMKRNAGETKT